LHSFPTRRSSDLWPAQVRRLLHAGVALGFGGAALPAVGLAHWAPYVTAAAGMAAGAACGLFVRDAWGLYAPRGRERVHPPLGYVRVAHGYLVVCALLAAVLAVMPLLGQRPPAARQMALGFVAAAGRPACTILGY